MVSKLFNRAKMTVASAPGTGPSIALGTAVAGFQSFSAAGVANGDTVSYALEDGTNFEIGTGTFNLSAGTLSRTVVASNGGTPPTAYTHLKLVCHTRAGGSYFQIADMQFLDIGGTAQTPSSADASSVYGTDVASNAIWGTSGVWQSAAGADGEYIEFVYGTGFAPGTIKVVSGTFGDSALTPVSVSLYGSNDGTTYTKILDFSFSTWSDAQTQTYTIQAPSSAQPINATSSAICYLTALAADLPQALSKLTDCDTTTAPPASGQALAWNGTKWAPASIGGASGVPPFAPPASANYTFDLNDGTPASIMDDASEGMIVAINTTPGGLASGDRIRAKLRPITTPTADWQIVVRMKAAIPQANYNAGGLFIHSTSNTTGHVIFFGFHQEPSVVVSLYNSSGTGFYNTYFQQNVFHGMDGYFKVTYTASSGALVFYYSRDNVNWWQLYSTTATTFLGAAPTHIGFGLGPNYTNPYGSISVACGYINTNAF